MAKTKNDVTTSEGAEALDEINANIERAASVAAGEALDTLKEETEELISSLSGKGSIAAKTEKREQMKAAAERAVEVPASAAAPEITYGEFQGVTELVTMGAKKLAEGVRVHGQASKVASEIAQITVDMWLRLPNSDGNPDLMGDSDRAKKAWGDTLRAAGQGFEHTFENEDSLKKLQRSVQDHRSDVRAQYLRALDGDDADAAEEREKFASVLRDKPKDVPVSRWVADYYATSLVGQSERKRIAYHTKKDPNAKLPEHLAPLAALEPGLLPGAGADDGLTPDERITTAVKRLAADVRKAKPADFKNASDEVKEAARTELNELYKAIKDMITATL